MKHYAIDEQQLGDLKGIAQLMLDLPKLTMDRRREFAKVLADIGRTAEQLEIPGK